MKMKNENTDKKGTCVYKKDIHDSQKGQGAATNIEKRAGRHSKKGGRCAL